MGVHVTRGEYNTKNERTVLNMKGTKPEYPEKTPVDELQKMPHTKAQKFKPQTRLNPAL